MSMIEQAIHQMRCGNVSGVNYIYKQFNEFLFKIARSEGLSIEDSEEITHNTFLKMIKAIHKFEYRNDNSFKAWLVKIHKNHIKEFKRKNRIQVKYLDDEEESVIVHHIDFLQDSTDPISNDPRLEAIRDEINKLSEDDRILLTMRAKEIPYELISEIIGVNPKTLKVRHHRLNQKLQKLLTIKFKNMNLL